MTEKNLWLMVLDPPLPRRYFLGPCMQYDQEIPQSYNADQHTVTLERATDQSLGIGRTTK